jgi:SAM-dependent methyltransferase
MSAPTNTSPADDWSAVASAWDANADYVDSHAAEATAALVDGLAVRPGDRVLELAAGPGVLGGRWTELTGPSGMVVLSDIAPGMVDVARRRNAHLGNAEVVVLDLASIEQPSDSFDAVACRMGLMFAPEPGAALGEIHRVLVSGGRLGALTWAGPEHNPWMTCVGMAAMMSGLVSGGPPVGPGGIFSLGDPTALATLAKEAGFVDVVVTEFPVTFEIEDIDEHVERVGSLAGPLAAAFAGADPERRAAVRRTAGKLAADYVADGGYVLPGRVLHLSGRAG